MTTYLVEGDVIYIGSVSNCVTDACGDKQAAN